MQTSRQAKLDPTLLDHGRLRVSTMRSRENSVMLQRRAEHAERQLTELTSKLLRAQEDERRRIARELHDVTAQGIGLIMLNLGQLQQAAAVLDERSRAQLAESLEFAEEALRDVRTLSYVLHPPLLDQAGLNTALRWFARGFSERSGIKVSFIERRPDAQRLSPEAEYALFRVVQECLTNVRRHAKSETAEICLTNRATEVVLSIRDHGRGCEFRMPDNDETIEQSGVGILSMRHRLKELGGELHVDSDAHGTTVTAIVPRRLVT